jgi:hypothetical protein
VRDLWTGLGVAQGDDDLRAGPRRLAAAREGDRRAPVLNYALLDEQEAAILGCVYVDPPERVGSDGEVSWWVVNDLVGTDMERALDALVPPSPFVAI